jgi:hypothetical protein
VEATAAAQELNLSVVVAVNQYAGDLRSQSFIG